MRRLRFLIVLAIAAALLLPCSVVFAQQPTKRCASASVLPGQCQTSRAARCCVAEAAAAPCPNCSSRRTRPIPACRRSDPFIPHLLVVPVATEVFFPNADPFYHNVFSAFRWQALRSGIV